MFFFETNVKGVGKVWPRMERYQNSTLRFSPGEDFPAHLEQMIGRPRIMRCFLTLNDAWDYRTDQYHYNFLVGEDIYADDSTVASYDRDECKPSPYGLTYLQHIKSHGAHADYILLSFRRYEREVADGYISLDKYEEVLEHLLEYYKNAVPNIRYLEFNETNQREFGGLTGFEFYEFYKRLYKIANRLNKKHQYDIPLEVGGPTFAEAINQFGMYEQFLRLYASDRDPEKKMDFYATHEYTTNMTFLPTFYRKHHELLRTLGLPELPIFFNEYGATDYCTPDPYYNQLNAAASIEMLIEISALRNFYVFPWCSYHDPNIQVDRTQYIDFNRQCGYLPTFLGQAYIALSRLLEFSLPLDGNIGNKAVVTTDGKNYVVLASNRDDKPHDLQFTLNNLHACAAMIEEYKVDALHNNCFINRAVDTLQCTGSFEVPVSDGHLTISDTLDSLGFTLWVIKPTGETQQKQD